MSAWDDLQKFLNDGEELEAIVFGEYGWGGYGEDEVFVPSDKQGVILTPEESRPLMNGWEIYGGYGSPDCYAIYAWTNKRVIWVTQYDGSTSLDSAPRNPEPVVPEMPGG